MNGEPQHMRSEDARPGDKTRALGRRRPRERRKRLRSRIQALEDQVAEFRANENARLYGLTPGSEAAIAEAIANDDERRILRLARPLHPADFADLIERLSGDDREALVTAIGSEFDPEVLVELNPLVRDEVIGWLGEDILANCVSCLPVDDAVEVVGDLEPAAHERVFRAITADDRTRVEEALAYPEDTAGRLMHTKPVAIPGTWTVGQVIDFLRTHDDFPGEFHDIYVVGDDGRARGKVSLSRLLRTRRPVLVTDIVQTRFHSVFVHMDQEDVALLFRQYGLTSAPVVDADGLLVGVIDIDDVVSVIDEEAEEDLMRLGGVQEGDLHGGLVDTTRSRFSWLAVNLATAIVASIVIAFFETTIEKVVALAILMPIVASMGGNAGTQALTVAVRALAMRELTATNATKFVLKETTVGSMNGIAFAVIAGAATWIWFGDLDIALILGAAMVITLIVAGFFGTMIPIGLERLKLDPAIASTVFLTTVTDVVGFLAFLGLAAFFLL